MRVVLRALALPLAAVLSLGSLTACSGGDETDSDAPRSGGGGDFSVLAAVAQLPAGESTGLLTVSTADIAATARANGVHDLASPDSATALHGLTDDTLVALGSPFNQSEQSFEQTARYGTDWRTADWFVENQDPLRRFTLLSGGRSPEFPDSLVDLGGGVRSFGDGEDAAVDLASSDLSPDRLGRPVRVAQRDDLAVWSLSTDAVRDWLAGPNPSLADDPDVALVARTLDEHDVVSAQLFRGGDDPVLGIGWQSDGTVHVVFPGPVQDENLLRSTWQADGRTRVTDIESSTRVSDLTLDVPRPVAPLQPVMSRSMPELTGRTD